jgi:hypothetical protein
MSEEYCVDSLKEQEGFLFSIAYKQAVEITQPSIH